jgi:hypothetical protein
MLKQFFKLKKVKALNVLVLQSYKRAFLNKKKKQETDKLEKHVEVVDESVEQKENSHVTAEKAEKLSKMFTILVKKQ